MSGWFSGYRWEGGCVWEEGPDVILLFARWGFGCRRSQFRTFFSSVQLKCFCSPGAGCGRHRDVVPTPCFSEGLSFSSQRTHEWLSLLGQPEQNLCCPWNLEFTPKWTNTNSQRLANRQEQKGRENRGSSSGPYHTGARDVTDQGPRSCGSWDGTRDMGLGRLSGSP